MDIKSGPGQKNPKIRVLITAVGLEDLEADREGISLGNEGISPGNLEEYRVSGGAKIAGALPRLISSMIRIYSCVGFL